MHTQKTRLVVVGVVLLLGATAFFLFMLSIASGSNDPAELMRIVGTVSGTVGGLGIAVIAAAVLRRSAQRSSAAPATVQSSRSVV